MAEVTPAALREAAGVPGIQEQATLNEIRQKYHELVKRWHPDVSKDEPTVSHEMTIRLKKAFDILVDYCMNHFFCSGRRISHGTWSRALQSSGCNDLAMTRSGGDHTAIFPLLHPVSIGECMRTGEEVDRQMVIHGICVTYEVRDRCPMQLTLKI